MEYISKRLEDTQKIASEFAKTLKEGDVLCMYGDLGAGKTAFVQGLAKGLGIEDHVTSPKSFATAFETLLLPAPAGPSTATAICPISKSSVILPNQVSEPSHHEDTRGLFPL